MPQFYALQCFQCEQYQVTQARKDKKFTCKLCGAKQSVRRIFARSHAAKDVRLFIQQLNLARGTAAEAYDDIAQDTLGNQQCEANEHIDGHTVHDKNGEHLDNQDGPNNSSRWDLFLNRTEPGGTASVNYNLSPVHSDDNLEFVTQLPDQSIHSTRCRMKRKAIDSDFREIDTFTFPSEEQTKGRMNSTCQNEFSPPLKSRRGHTTVAYGTPEIKENNDDVKCGNSRLGNSLGADVDGMYTLNAPGDTIVEDEICF